MHRDCHWWLFVTAWLQWSTASAQHQTIGARSAFQGATPSLSVSIPQPETGRLLKDVAFFGPYCNLSELVQAWMARRGIGIERETKLCGAPGCMHGRVVQSMLKQMQEDGITHESQLFHCFWIQDASIKKREADVFSDQAKGAAFLRETGVRHIHLGCGDLAELMERQCAVRDAALNQPMLQSSNDAVFSEHLRGEADGCFGNDWLHIDGDQAALPQAHEEYMELIHSLDSGESSSHTFNHDLRLGLPFPDASIASIYSEHLVEHLPPDGLRALMEECYRVLSPGGVMRISTPDLAKYLRGYVAQLDRIGAGSNGLAEDTNFLEDHASRFPPMCCSWEEKDNGTAQPRYSGASVVNNIMRNYGHSEGWLWDVPSFIDMLSRGANIPRSAILIDEYRPHDLAETPALSHLAGLDFEMRRDESMYVRITKAL